MEQQIRGNGRGEHRACHEHDRKDATVPEEGQPKGAEQGGRCVKDKARLALIQAERLQAVVEVEQVCLSDRRSLPAPPEDRPSGVGDWEGECQNRNS
jgi:hypothetical protein